MKAVRFHKTGGPEVLVYEDVPEPKPGPGEVLIRVEAVGLNYADTMRRSGAPYPEPSPTPFMLGGEVAGTIAVLGEGVDKPAVGTPVFALAAGGYAQFVTVPAARVTPIWKPFDFHPVGINPPEERPMNEASAESVFRAFTSPRKRPLSDEEKTLLDQAERHSVPHEGIELAAWTWGHANPQRRRVLLVHGWESRASHWTAFVPVLLEAGFQVCAFDAPAHGESPGEQSDVMANGRAIGSVAAHLGPVHAVIGHSGGSASALYAFSRGLRVQASVHLSGPSSLVRVLDHVARSAQLPPDLGKAFRKRFEGFLGQSASAMDVERLQGGLRHPALLLHDPDDAEVPYAESVALRDAWLQATLEPVHGLGHRRILKNRDVVARVARFVRLHASGALGPSEPAQPSQGETP